ncbi:Phosphoglycerate dehydrogenase or related dehydrogenase [Geosmithia morbida]|uniref:Phosphoglycerate dehydrogenase or related dehydrogenase n=1 Tax=Geosmithia morbida TaxID=1094350 RepID=A0A9P5D0Z0_9HYPO|nr:Phosphoglycerate dehydrogenase or related dehydrogenase [Geosmithia morbida]KAF4119926.1 Phosphoglycerate dehydrogenase or related dehydrogenase [Geosmithia morbida]
MKLLYPTSLALDTSKLEGFSVDIQPYDPKSPTIPSELLDATVLVTWVNTHENLVFASKNMPNLRWIQSLAAGPNDVLSAGFDTSRIVVTTGSGLHDRTVAEHALGLLLNGARRFYEMRDYQLQGKWPAHLGGAQPDRPKDRFTTLRDARVLVWGFGNIAKTLVPSLTLLGAHVEGVARSAGVRNGITIHAEADLPTLLPKIDVLVMILPGSDSTRNALNAERLRLLPKHAWVVNVGRGTTIDEAALADALNAGEIGGAALDVFETEPLPVDSRLWKAPNLVLSPHAAGGRPQDAEDLITYNLRRFVAKQPLKNVV